MMVEMDVCEQCNAEVPVDDLKESPDVSDGNLYLTCHSCRRKNNRAFQAELEESYGDEEDQT